MIKKIPHKKIDREKYTQVLRNSINYKIYAEPYFLDALLGKNWFCYVWDDYEVIMPVAYDKKLLMTRVIQPLFCQQLGLFYSKQIKEDIYEQFHQLLSKNWVKIYAFNDANTVHFTIKGQKRNNYILDLQKEYSRISANYHKNTQRNIQKAAKHGLELVLTDSLQGVLDIKQQEKDKKIELFQEFAQKLISLKKAQVWEVYDAEKNLNSAAFLIEDNQRIIYSFSGSTKKGRANNSMFYLLDAVIKNYAERAEILDFEGSMKRSIATFFNRFGAVNYPYTIVKK